MEVKEILKKHGFLFKKQWGQNFLTDANLLRAIVQDAGLSEDSVVLEIGAGAGALTGALARSAKKVIAYEIDEKLKPVLKETLAEFDNVELVFSDFQRISLAEFEEKYKKYRVVANLPYYVTTPIVMRFVEEAKGCEGITVMVQEEVAERFCAKAGTEEYGAVTAAIARCGTCKITRRVGRELFMPRPNVDSAVVKIDFTQGGFAVKSAKAYRDTVRCAFLNRRKTLENNLMNTLKIPREQAKEILRAADVPDGVRGETLSPDALGVLSDLLFEKGLLK